MLDGGYVDVGLEGTHSHWSAKPEVKEERRI